MIKDNIKNAELYYGLSENIKTTLEFLKNYTGKADEKADIPVADGIMVKCRPYMTKPESECSFEAHKRDIDIHFVVSGDEKIGYADISTLKVIDVNEEKDMIYLEGEGDNVYLGEGDFMITFPQDAHMPCVIAKESKLCCKLIAKIRI